MVGTDWNLFDFGRSRLLENAFLKVVWFACIHQFKYSWYYAILLKFERTDVLSSAVLQNQINQTNKLKQTPIFDVSEKFWCHIYHLCSTSILWIQPIISNNFITIANLKNTDHTRLASMIELVLEQISWENWTTGLKQWSIFAQNTFDVVR